MLQSREVEDVIIRLFGLEGVLVILTDTFDSDDLTDIALRSCGAILGVDLHSAFLRPIGSKT